MSKTSGGALLGATVGALGGLAVGHDANSRRNAALIGAGIGALGGGLIGNYMDQQEAQLRAELQGTGVSVTRAGDRIILNMPSNITFDTDQDAIKPEFYPTLNSVAIVLNKFNKTLVDVNGHTDSVGNAAYNQGLSERRAMSVATYLGGQGLDQRRVFGAWLRHVAAGGVEFHAAGPRPEPPRGNPDRPDPSGLILLS